MRDSRRSDPAKEIYYSALELRRRYFYDARAPVRAARGRQRQDFDRLSGTYERHLDRFSDEPVDRLLSRPWRYFYREPFGKHKLTGLPFSFLSPRHDFGQLFGYPFDGAFFKTGLEFLERRLSQGTLEAVLTEDFVGEPELFAPRPAFSWRNILHLHHLIRFTERTGCDLGSLRTVVEWGGGYGNMAKVLTRLDAGPRTYIIIDLPRVSCIQWLYLATIFGEDKVRLLESPTDPVRPGLFNLLPVSFLAGRSLAPDLFLSTFALNESSEHAMNLCSRRFFGTNHLLLAFQASGRDWVESEKIRPLAERAGAVIEDIVPGAYWYAFR